MKSKHIFFILVFILFCTYPAQAQEIKGKVVAISDGDTLTLLDANKRQLKIRLAEIDTPESKQPYGKRAKQALSKLVFAKTATVEVQDKDRYGRIVGRVYVDDINVNAEMVRQGAAWVYRQYAKDQALYDLETKARQDKTGLWGLSESERVPPWEWRHQRRKQKAGDRSKIKPKAIVQRQGGFQCDGKTTCKQMRNCSEARFYLEQCGLTRIDGDGDGVPCESLCR